MPANQTWNISKKFLDNVDKDDIEGIFELYHRYWMHSGQRVKVKSELSDSCPKSECGLNVLKRSESREWCEGVVQSIDQDGFLLVEVWSADGSKVVRSVHPDGNSFDMMQGLIMPKPRQTT